MTKHTSFRELFYAIFTSKFAQILFATFLRLSVAVAKLYKHNLLSVSQDAVILLQNAAETSHPLRELTAFPQNSLLLALHGRERGRAEGETAGRVKGRR